jgi:hypothetical protein
MFEKVTLEERIKNRMQENALKIYDEKTHLWQRVKQRIADLTNKPLKNSTIMAIPKKNEPSPYHYNWVMSKKIKKFRERHVRRIKHENKHPSAQQTINTKEDTLLAELTEKFNSEDHETSYFLSDLNLTEIQLDGTSILSSYTGDLSDVFSLFSKKRGRGKIKDEFWVIGKNKFESELEYCNSIPEGQRYIYINHILNDQGEGEPEQQEEIIQMD